MTVRFTKTAIGLGAAFALMSSGIASAAPVRAEPSTAGLAPAVSCSTSLPPSGSFLEATYSQPNACGKCVAAGSAYEATGNYRAYCRYIRDGSSIVAVQLWLFCVVCRSDEPLASRAVAA
ncbi:hypothetical protein [Microbispora catharanthi]|uniref:Uncharacterized protein n=1 Tax=Microbispora catharanthi TaxID=1712871 RepID=A0A5N6C2W2_9ACTN|nr:hypothetical protein [Microbispora catharanthi]KAB8187051.1 hypothetical protein FH610_003605 [Microbispora catharanthi]